MVLGFQSQSCLSFTTSQVIVAMSSSLVLVQLFIAACWACIDVTSYINPRFKSVLDCYTTLSALFCLVDVTFCHGLLDAVQSDKPPSVTWFESLSSYVPKNVWGIYVLVLRKPGEIPLLYIGSGTSTYRGVRSRFKEHRDHILCPANVQKALDYGYEFSHMALLAHCPIPSAASIPKMRTVLVALEAVFTGLFWAIIPSEKKFGLWHMCPWDQDSLEWLGLCSHNPLCEAIQDRSHQLDLTPAQLEEEDRIRKEFNRQYQINYARRLRANPTEKHKQRQAINNRKQQPNTKANQEAAVRNKTFYCQVCDVACRDNASLVKHNETRRHQRKLEHGVDGFQCHDCNISFRYESAYNVHKLSKGHIAKSSL